MNVHLIFVVLFLGFEMTGGKGHNILSTNMLAYAFNILNAIHFIYNDNRMYLLPICYPVLF